MAMANGADLPVEQQKQKARLVYRETGQKVTFAEVHALSATIHVISVVLFIGMLPWNDCGIANAKKAYLQAPLRSLVPTWVVLPPPPCWLDGWNARCSLPCVRLLKALYGHPESGDDWHDFFKEILEKYLHAYGLELHPSLWWIESERVLIATYVDDIIASGPTKALDRFWKAL